MRDEDKTKRQLITELAALRRLIAESERALPESEDPFRHLLEHVADACFIMARDGSFIDVNQRACDSLGYTREELLASSEQVLQASRLTACGPPTEDLQVARQRRRRLASRWRLADLLFIIPTGGEDDHGRQGQGQN